MGHGSSSNMVSPTQDTGYGGSRRADSKHAPRSKPARPQTAGASRHTRGKMLDSRSRPLDRINDSSPNLRVSAISTTACRVANRPSMSWLAPGAASVASNRVPSTRNFRTRHHSRPQALLDAAESGRLRQFASRNASNLKHLNAPSGLGSSRDLGASGGPLSDNRLSVLGYKLRHELRL